MKEDKIANCKFEFKCPLEWDDLEKSNDEKVRFCSNCQKNVYLADSMDEIIKFGREGKCISSTIPESLTSDPRPLKFIYPPGIYNFIEYEGLEVKKTALEKKKSWWQFWK